MPNSLLFLGDNLVVLRGHLEGESIELIYLVAIKLQNQLQDTWKR